MLGLLTQYIVPFAIVAVGLTGLGVLLAVGRNWIKVSPNTIAIVSGRKYKVMVGETETTRGYRIIAGGGFFKFPILEKVEYLSLNVMSFPVEVQEVPDKMGALVTVKGIANVKVSSAESSIGLAVERFLGFNVDAIKGVARENLESNLRAIVGTLTIESLIQDRSSLQEAVLREAVSDLKKMGLQVDLLNVQDVRDDRGYIDSLGKSRTAEVKRDAAIGEAQAMRDSDLSTSEANQQGEVAKANAARAVSDAERERDVQMAKNAALVQADQARIEIAAKTAAAQESEKLKVATVEAEIAETNARSKLQEAEKVRREKELDASQIVGAEKDKEARIIAAQADQEAAEREGEAERIKQEKIGLGEQAKLTAIAEGRKAAAEATEAELVAEAEGIKAKGLAEAEALRKKAEAYAELQDAGKLLMAIEASPAAILAIGTALGEVMKPVAASVGEGMASIGELKIIDMGGANGNGHGNVLKQFVNTPAETIFELVEKFAATGTLDMVLKAAQAAGLELPASIAGGGTPGNGSPDVVVEAEVPAPPPAALETEDPGEVDEVQA